MGCQTSRLSGSFNVVHSTHDEGRYFHQAAFPSHHNHDRPPQPPQYTRPDSPSVYSAQTRSTPAHSRNNSNENNQFSSTGIKQPLLASSKPMDYGGTANEKSKFSSGFSTMFFTSGSNNRRTGFKSTHSRRKSGQKTPHFVFQTEKPLPAITPEALSDHSPVIVGSCGHPRQQGTPCFACLREKPKPRRHRSRRNAQVMIPRASFVPKRWRSSRSSTEPTLKPEDLPPWVTNRPSVFIREGPVTSTANPHPLSQSTTRTNEKGDSKQKGGKTSLGQSTTTSASTNAYPDSIMRGYIVPSEVYYATLPLPALPTESVSVFGTKKRKNPVWI